MKYCKIDGQLIETEGTAKNCVYFKKLIHAHNY